MTWRGSSTPSDRVFACLVYLLPLLDVLRFSDAFFSQFPALKVVLFPIAPLRQIYSLPFASFIVFLAVFLLVVRNESIAHFIRFNAMQAILISIVVFLCQLLIDSLLTPVLGGSLILETLNNVVFLGVIAAVVYSVIQSAMGRYAEIPTISDAVYMQVR